MRWILITIALAACSKPSEPAATAAVISKAEVDRATEVCAGYVAKLCACTAQAAKDECPAAKALPEAVGIAGKLATNPKADAEDAHQAAGMVRKTVKQCVEATAKLPELGC